MYITVYFIYKRQNNIKYNFKREQRNFVDPCIETTGSRSRFLRFYYFSCNKKCFHEIENR